MFEDFYLFFFFFYRKLIEYINQKKLKRKKYFKMCE